MDKVKEFSFPITIKAEYTENNVPWLAQEVASIPHGRFKGTVILMGIGGPMLQVMMDGEDYGYIGFTYTALATATLFPFSNHVKPNLAAEVVP